MTEVQIVQKESDEFKAAYKQYLELFFSSKEEDYIRKGVFTHGEHEGKALGLTSKKVFEANLPMPFGCPDLFIQPCTEKGKVVSVIWFCDRVGCICSCCRQDMTDPKEAYPTYCPTQTIEDQLAEEWVASNEEEWEEEW